MTQLQQTDIIPGQSSTATFPSLNRNGGIDLNTGLMPPGKAPKLPNNLATTDMLAQLVSGHLGLRPTDQAVLGLAWDGVLGIPRLTYGTLDKQITSSLLGATPQGLYLTERGNIVPEMSTGKKTLLQTFTIQNARDGMTVPYPQQYSDDDTVVFLTPEAQQKDGTWIMPWVGAYNYNRANFTLTRYFTDPGLNGVTGTVKCLSIGSI